MKIKIGDLAIRQIDYRELKPLQGALKDLSTKNYQKLKKSFEKKGMFVPLFVWEKPDGDLMLLDGHGRERLFMKESPVFQRPDGSETTEVPCVIVQAKDLKDAKEKLLIISSQYQQITVEGFQEFTFDLDGDFLNDVTPFDDLMKEMPRPEESATEEDEAEIEVPVEPTSKLGDLYELGAHRLLCGDSANPEHVGHLMAGQKAQLVFTDPPYNVGEKMKGDFYKGTNMPALKELAEVEWDKDFDIGPVFKMIELAAGPDVAVYVCTSQHLAGEIWAWMSSWTSGKAGGFYGYTVWVKPNPAPSLAKRHWTWATELICYATRGKHRFNFPAQGHALSFWTYKARDGKRIHPTQKPIAVPEHAILHSSNAGDVVLDLFGGSGTTLMACEVQGRKCRMMELSPAYCDAIVARWEALTKQKAKLIRNLYEEDQAQEPQKSAPEATKKVFKNGRKRA